MAEGRTNAGGGGFNKSVIIVTAPTGSTVTCTKGTTVKTATEKNGEWWFKNLDIGEWTLNATLAGQSATLKYNIEQFGVYRVAMRYSRVYGIVRDTEKQSTEWERTNDAVDFSATASVGTTPGSSDFDSAYPWSDIKRVNWPTNDVLVKLPKFYYNRWIDETSEHIIISDVKTSNTEIHPAFYRNGKELDEIYVAAYKTSSGNKSVSGASPTGSQTRSAMRTNAKAKGAGWGLIDIACVSAIEMLMLVEFANNDVQSAIGRGFCEASASLNTGTTDNVPNLTGRPAGTDGKVDVVWRGIEGFWGNVHEWVDGLNWSNNNYYVCNDPSKYADDTSDGYSLLSYSGSPSWSESFITKMGIDSGNNKHVILPVEAGSGSGTTYYADTCSSSESGWRVAHRGGYWGIGSKVGLFTLYLADASSVASSARGSRMMYIPQEVV